MHNKDIIFKVFRARKPYNLLYLPSQQDSKTAILIVPNTEGYYAVSRRYGEARDHINSFRKDLSKKHHVYYLLLPGQNPQSREKEQYSWENSLSATEAAILFIETQHLLVGVIGMCTGAEIAVEALIGVKRNSLPLVLYNTAPNVRLNTVEKQGEFLRTYAHMRLNKTALINDSMPGEIIQKYTGPLLQIISGSSDYSVADQLLIKKKVPSIKQITFLTMSDVPIETSREYGKMIEKISSFFNK
jgi:hypothetical protein